MLETLQRDIAEIRQHLGTLDSRVGVIDSKMDSLSPRDWVRELIDPIKECMIRQEEVVSRLSEDVSAVCRTQDSLLKEKSQHDREEHNAKLVQMEAKHAEEIQQFKALAEQRRVSAILKEWAVPVGFITAVFVLWNHIAPVLTAIIKALLNG